MGLRSWPRTDQLTAGSAVGERELGESARWAVFQTTQGLDVPSDHGGLVRLGGRLPFLEGGVVGRRDMTVEVGLLQGMGVAEPSPVEVGPAFRLTEVGRRRHRLGAELADEAHHPGNRPGEPRMVRLFVSEFGAQAVPATADFCEPERWPDLDWARLGHNHALQKTLFDRHVPPADYATFDEWRAATQAYQATVVRRHIETLRRLKYRPDGRIRPVPVRRQRPGGDLVGARPRSQAQGRRTSRCRPPALR